MSNLELKESDIADIMHEIEKAVSSMNHRSDRANCREKSFNDLIKSTFPDEEEKAHIAEILGERALPKFLVVDKFYAIRFR